MMVILQALVDFRWYKMNKFPDISSLFHKPNVQPLRKGIKQEPGGRSWYLAAGANSVI